MDGASEAGASDAGASEAGASEAGAWVGAVDGAVVAAPPPHAAIRMADAALRAISLRETCNVELLLHPGHPRQGTGPAVL